MPKLSPVTWKVFVKKLRENGFEGPYQVGKHPYMVFSARRITIPNPHEGVISVDLLIRLLRQAGISRDEWTRINNL